jgi:hypothetical protein
MAFALFFTSEWLIFSAVIRSVHPGNQKWITHQAEMLQQLRLSSTENLQFLTHLKNSL